MKLLVVEDHALVREGLLLTLRRLGRQCGLIDAQDAPGALAALEREPDIDMILLDLLLPGVNGMSFLATVRRRFPTIPVLVVSGIEEADAVRAAIDAGASGFVPKSSDSEVLLSAVRCVADGGVFLPESIPLRAGMPGNGKIAKTRAGAAKRAEQHLADLGLTSAQRRVFDLLVQGCTNRQIAELLGLTEGTVKVHVSHIYRLLGVASRSQAMVVAARLGMTF